MTKRSFIKAALVTPFITLAGQIIPEQKYGFNFVGDLPVESIADFEFFHSPYYHELDEHDLLSIIHGHYSSGVLFHKRIIEIPDKLKHKDDIIEDAVFSEMTSIEGYYTNLLEPGKSFTTLKEYHKYPTPLMEKLNMRLKQNKYTVDVYTDFPSFKNMMDTKYKGNYSQEFSDDIRRMNF